MLDKKCIVIFYAKGIYDTAALSLAESLELNHKDIHVVTIADDEVTSWKYSQIRRRSYIFSARNIPFCNMIASSIRQLAAAKDIKKSRKDYKEFKKPSGGFGKWIYSIKIKYRKVYNALLRFDPEVVICTTPELLSKVNKAKFQLGGINMSVCALISDYQLDKRFVHYKTDGYFVPNESVKQGLIKYNIDEDIITVINLPIRLKHKYKHNRSEILAKYDITNEMRNIVFMGGRYGQACIKDAYMKLAELANDNNIFILTGESEGLSKYCSYVATSKNVVENVYIVDSVEDMSEIYSIADTIICSPTAYITYEAMYHNVRLVLTKGADKMEKLNAHYLTTNSLALQGNSTDEVIASLEKYANDNEFDSAIVQAQTNYVNAADRASLEDMVYQVNCLLAEEKATAEQKRQLIINGGNLLDGSTVAKPAVIAQQGEDIKITNIDDSK